MRDRTPKQPTVPIVHDAPLTEIYAIDRAGNRHRVYRGDTAEHIQWKIDEHQVRLKEKIDVVVVGEAPPAAETAGV